jgi:hypothetical protein
MRCCSARPYGYLSVVTFYESNREVRETGAEVAEFDDAPPVQGADEDEAAYDRNLPGSEEPPAEETVTDRER